jgi:hypothetical protein
MFSVCYPTPDEMTSALHPTYHYETTPPIDRLAARIDNMEVSKTRANNKYTAQSASPTLQNNDQDHIKVKRSKSKLPGHLLVKSYRRLKGK